MEYNIKLKDIQLDKDILHIAVEGTIRSNSGNYIPRLKLHFKTCGENRIIPLVINDIYREKDSVKFEGKYDYLLKYIFWESRTVNDFFVTISLIYGAEEERKAHCQFDYNDSNCMRNEKYAIAIDNDQIHFKAVQPQLLSKHSVKHRILKYGALAYYWVWNLVEFLPRKNQKVIFANKRKSIFYRLSAYSKRTMLKYLYQKTADKESVSRNQIVFISQRSDAIEGNAKFVYERLQENKELQIKTYLNKTFFYEMTYADLKAFATICATSRIIIADEYVQQLYPLEIRDETKIIQLWHACGAFKTFGFSRLGKPDGSSQKSRVHRNYDKAIVSSESVRECYAEGFGISTEKVIATGIPRTDLFFKKNVIEDIKKKWYSRYPELENKKIILFAPTFRGTVKEQATYPMEQFDISSIMQNLSDEYAIIIKHHPFVKEKHHVPEEYKDRVKDFSHYSEINELLFISDIVITDYSSIIFEAALMKKSIIFYVFDLEEYIRDRDFYFDFPLFVNNNAAYSIEELVEIIHNSDSLSLQSEILVDKYMGACKGSSTENVIKEIIDLM